MIAAPHQARGARRRRASWWTAAIVALSLVAACGGERATEADYRLIFHRLTELELAERGFRDRALVAHKERELDALFRQTLAQCVGKRLAPGVRACLAAARSTEAVSHDCL
ncbi:MAG: hypothetical protein IPG96_06310 [Proteobacteria bacterium]|nr:hypothetical protein [Pseudomonadota bacterium]